MRHRRTRSTSSSSPSFAHKIAWRALALETFAGALALPDCPTNRYIIAQYTHTRAYTRVHHPHMRSASALCVCVFVCNTLPVFAHCSANTDQRSRRARVLALKLSAECVCVCMFASEWFMCGTREAWLGATRRQQRRCLGESAVRHARELEVPRSRRCLVCAGSGGNNRRHIHTHTRARVRP